MSALIQRYSDLATLERLLSEGAASEWAVSPEEMRAVLTARVRGQNHVIDDLVPLVTRQFAKLSRKTPVANLLFVGPTGTGKTELCRALAEFLYGSDETLITYDCGQFKNSADLYRLIGSPQGIAGGPGHLTTKLITNRRRVVVFDEVEKAHQDVVDILLSLMGQASVQDQKTNKVADFSDAIVVLTSNAEQDALSRLQSEICDVHELGNAVRVHLRECGCFRPEIIGRLTRVYVFRELDGIVRAEIVVLKIRRLAEDYGLTVEQVAPEIIHELVQQGDKLSDFGARQREQVVDDLLAEPFLLAKRNGAKHIEVATDEAGDIYIR